MEDRAGRAWTFGWLVVVGTIGLGWLLGKLGEWPEWTKLPFAFTFAIAFIIGVMSLFLAFVMALFSHIHLYPGCDVNMEQQKCETRVAKLWDKAQKLEAERIAAMIELWELQDSLQRERMDIEEMKWLDAPPELDVLSKSDVLIQCHPYRTH